MILILTTLGFLSQDSLNTLCYTTYSILKIQLIFKLLTLFYLQVMYIVIMHTHLEAHHLHTKKRETYSQKINSYERQKG